MTNSQTKERLRVLHVISGDLWAGAEAQAYTLLKHLEPLCDVHAVLMNDGELAERLRACDIPVTVFDETKLNAWQILLSLRKKILSLKPNVVHTHRQKENILGAIANTTTIKAVSVRTVHGAPEHSAGAKTRLLNRLDSWIGKVFQHKIIVVSNELKDQLTPIFNGKLIRVSNGVDVQRIRDDVTKGLDLGADLKHIGIVGRLTHVKRVDLFLRIAHLIKSKPTQKYHFHIVGEGPLSEELQRQSEQLNILDIVTFHGFRKDIPDVLSSLDGLIICSDHEGLPMVALESISLGTPIITSKQGGLAEIPNGPLHIGLESNSVEAYSNAICLLEKPSSIEFPTEFSAQQMALNTYNAY